MSKKAYRAYILGMYTKLLRSLLFNLLVFSFGLSIGMGFTVIHMKRVWKDTYESSTVMKLEHSLRKYGIENREIDNLMLELKDK